MVEINGRQITAKEFDSILEQLIDETSLCEVLSTMSSICFNSAESLKDDKYFKTLRGKLIKAGKVLDDVSNHNAIEALL